MQASPLHKIVDRFGDSNESDSKEARKSAKDALIKAVSAFVKKGDLLEDEFSEKGVERVSNRKLLKLLELAETVQDEFGSRSALIDKMAAIESREKDASYREHLESYRLPALYSQFKAAEKRTRG